MRGRVIGAAVLTGLVGLGGGAAAAYVVKPAPTGGGVGAPVPAVSPSQPFLPTTPAPLVNPDIVYPPLATSLPLERIRVGNTLGAWSFVKPKAWQAYCVGRGGVQTATPDKDVGSCTATGIYFRPADEPLVGGYSLRVKLLSDFHPQEYMASAKRADIVGSPDYREVTVLPETTSTKLYFTLLTPQSGTAGYLRRYNFFQWFSSPGSSTATMEISVTGRTVDAPGLRHLFDTFAAELKPIT